ncbi:hypothetical protein GDO78_017057 [Eleutherodactylus coqui]|uniref:ABC transporter domain-containing protein n=1 Tax=Eleutherodactylus coqui TaxID=57060 RepID=A0A8J6BLV8_ELECQ|nr:hypothetical protein GDO78_017057 [Eleutherodactylus coqui]
MGRVWVELSSRPLPIASSGSGRDKAELSSTHSHCKCRSGGERQRAEGEVLLLDEPTAGLDPCSRHHVWAMLKERKVDRATLLSTQFMDEADILADLFLHLDGLVGQDISSYGVSVTTLNDVFLKLEGEAEIEGGDYAVFSQEMMSEEEKDILSSEMEDSVQLMSDVGNSTVSEMALWRQQVMAIARIRFLKLRHNMKGFRALLLLVFLFLISVIVVYAIFNIKMSHMWELRPDLYFLGAGDRNHTYYSPLLINNNTGSPIEDFINAVKAQNIVTEVINGPYDPNTTAYKGVIEVSGKDEIIDVLQYGAAIILYVYVISFLFRRGKRHHDRWSFFFVMASFIPVIMLEAMVYYTSFAFLYMFLLPPSALIGMLMTVVSRTLCLTTRRKGSVKLNPENIDDAEEEVVAERETVKQAKASKHLGEAPAIIVDNLRKEFKVKSGFCGFKKKKRVATKNISFCVKRGEVLGLLGPNGAGKSTSIYMLAGEIKPTAGEIVLHGAQCSDGSNTFLGFCCQDNPLWSDMTVKQHLEIYAAVKGMKKEDGALAIRRVSEALELKEHLNKPAKKLSAGVSRKVCFAISMLGNPPIVLLDEPSTGLDPKGQQRMWFSVLLVYKIPMTNVKSLSQAFLHLEEAKHLYNIEEYSFSQPTLEQVFLELVREQEKEDCELDATFRWKKLRTESI